MGRTRKPILMWRKETIQELLEKNDTAVLRAVLAIYDRQTEDEKDIRGTRHLNSVGYSGVDGEIMSSFARQIQKRNSLSPKQMVIARKKMKRYWRQLVEIANENGKNPVESPTVTK